MRNWMLNSTILYNALKLSEEIYDESQYGIDDLYRIKDISHSLDLNHWHSKSWLAEELCKLYNHPAGKILVVGGWYGLMAYQLRSCWPDEQMNIISTDMDPMCEEYGYKLFKGNNIQYKTLVVNSKLDLSGYTAIVNTSCEHMEPEAVQYIIDNKDENAWVAFQSNDYYGIDSHINCSPSLEYWKDELKLDWFAYAAQQKASLFNRFMIIGK